MMFSMLVFASVIMLPGNVDMFDTNAICSPGYTRFTNNHNHDSSNQQICVNIKTHYKENLHTWEEANQLCRSNFSFLLDVNSEYYNTSLLEQHFSALTDGELLWTSIKKVNGFYFWQSNNSRLFKSSYTWGNKWNSDDEPMNDCVALNISNGNLITLDCSNTQLPYMCMNNGYTTKPIKTPACPDGWMFTYHLDTKRNSCFRLFPNSNFFQSFNICEEAHGELITVYDYHGIYNVLKDHYGGSSLGIAFWVNTTPKRTVGNNCTVKAKTAPPAKMGWKEENCFNELPFICKRPVKNLNGKIAVWISPFEMQSYPTSETKYLTCHISIDDHISQNMDDESLNYQWFKNGLPLEEKYKVINPGYVYDATKESGDIASRQGIYECKVMVTGFNRYFSSQEVEAFFSDFSTYVITLKGEKIPYLHTRAAFEDTMTFVNISAEILAKQLEQQIPFTSVSSDFQGISKKNSKVALQILLFLNWTIGTDIERPKNEESEVYPVLQETLKDNIHIFESWGEIEWDIKSVDKCFSENTTSDVLNVQMEWPESFRTKNATSIPLCINDKWQMNRRVCKANFNDGAKWQVFNASSCAKFQFENHDWSEGHNKKCNEGFSPMGNGACYKFYSIKLSWEDAYKKCLKDYSYMFTISPDDDETGFVLYDFLKFLGPQEEFWSGCKRQNGLFQWQGKTPRHMMLSDRLKWSPGEPKYGFDCVSLSGLKGEAFVARSQSCKEYRKFLCVQDRIMLSRIPTCSIPFESVLGENKCYYIGDNEVTFSEAQAECSKYQHAKLLTLENATSYAIFKGLVENKLYKTTEGWWIGLQWINDTYHWLNHDVPDLTFVDWSRNVDFNLVNASGLLKHSHKEENSSIKWNLGLPSEKYGFICENQKYEQYSEAWAHIKVQLYHQHYITDLYGSLPIPQLICEKQNSLYNSTVWYKDGIAIAGDLGISGSHTFYPLSVFKGNITVFDLIRSEGYYVCATEQLRPFQMVKSHEYLFHIDDMSTFVCTMVSSYNLSRIQDDFSSGKFLFKGPVIEEDLNGLFKSKFYVVLKNITTYNSNFVLCFHIVAMQQIPSKRQVEYREEKYWVLLNKHFSDTKDVIYPDLLKWIEKYMVQKDNITIRSSGYCYEEKWSSVDGIMLTWPKTAVGRAAVPRELCVSGDGEPVIRHCLGDFNSGAYWGDVNGHCSGTLSDLTMNLWKLANNLMYEGNVLDSAKDLRDLTSVPNDLKPIDVHYISVTLNNIANVASNSLGVINFTAESVNNVLNVQSEVLERMQGELNSSSRIAESLEEIVSTSKISKSMLKLSYSNLAVGTWNLQEYGAVVPVGLTVASNEEADNLGMKVLYNGSAIPTKDINAGILLPFKLVSQSLKPRLSFIVYRRGTLFNYNRYQSDFIVDSPVIHAYLGSERINNLNPPIEMYFKPLKAESDKSSPICCYWDQFLNRNLGGWSSAGCLFKGEKEGLYVCHCDHLTNFAVLLELNPNNVIPEGHELALSLITYIGCGLSIFGLSATVLTFLIFRKWRKGNKHQTLFNLSVALIAALIIFMVGIEKKKSKLNCIATAALLHYFLLVSISWMLMEAIIQYLNFVKVLSTYIPKFMQKAIFCAWGFPFIVVSIVLFVNYDSYYDHEKYCWLSKDALYYSFALPVIAILTSNIFMFCVIMYSITCGRPNVSHVNQVDVKLALTRFKAAVCIFFLLGLSWVFGFLAFGRLSLLFQYLFAITATSQGFFIFIFFVMREKATREMWINIFVCSFGKSRKPQNSESNGGVSMSRTHHWMLK